MKKIFKAVIIVIFGLIALWIALNIYAARLRADRTADKNWCANNMRMIDSAKEQFAQRGGATNGAVVIDKDITRFMKGYAMPTCRSSSTANYSIGVIGEDPECSVHGRLGNIHFPKHVPIIMKICKRGNWEQ